MASTGVSGSSQSSESESRSGVSQANRNKATDRTFNLVDTLLPQIQAFSQNVPTILTNPTTGLTPQQTNLVGNLVQSGVNSQFNKLSAGGALKGQMSPKNTHALVGTSTERALTSVLPQFVDIQQQNQLFNTTSAQNTQAQSFQFLQNLGGLLLGLTQGSEGNSQSSGSSFGFNFGVGG